MSNQEFARSASPDTTTQTTPVAPTGGGQRFACPSCGADMQFDPKSGQMKCPYCGHMEAVPTSVTEALGTIEERPIEAYLTPDAARLATLSATAVQVTCSGCGSVVEFEPPTVAGVCPFCGAQIVAQPRAADPLVAPEGVLPFAISQKDATNSIRQWIGSRWFAPNALKQQAQTGAVSGVYIPFWTYDSQTVSYYRGERGEHYWETEHYTDSDGKQQSRQVQKTRWYSASGRVDHFFDDVLVSATNSIRRDRLDALEPWGLENIKAYEPAYLSGFKAQRYQVDLAQGFEVARGVMASHIDSLVRRDIGGDEQRVHSVDTQHYSVTFKHILLPIYISAYRYQGKVFQVIVNARTGEVQGDRPYSFWKIFFLVLFILAALLFFYSLSQGNHK